MNHKRLEPTKKLGHTHNSHPEVLELTCNLKEIAALLYGNHDFMIYEYEYSI